MLQTTDDAGSSSETETQQEYQSKCEEAIVDMAVITRYGNDWKGTRAYKVARIDFTGNCNSTFETRSKECVVGQKSYVDYYQQKYGVVIRDGVGEGQLSDVFGQEVKACQEKLAA